IVARTFIPPQDQLEQVPLGSSSETSYPGYSIKEHKYGEAAREFGNYVSQAKAKGQDIKPEGVEYELGQSKALSSMKLEQMRAKKAAQNGTSSGYTSGSGFEPATAPKESNGASKKVRFSDLHQEASETGAPIFFMDPKPTPVNIPSTLNPPQKRKETSPDEATPELVQAPPEEARPSKKAKKSHIGGTNEVKEDAKSAQVPTSSQAKGDIEQAPEEIQIEYDDITAEVDKRMKEKEEKRKHKDWLKEEKKRKRDSEGSTAEAVDPTASITESEKPKKKKKKSRKSEDAGTVGDITQKRKSAGDGEELGEGDGVVAVGTDKPKKKKQKKKMANIEGDDATVPEMATNDLTMSNEEAPVKAKGEKKQKKKKKRKSA
ncbi:MAG: hypothetical protein Q9224_007132, partial [Gallowayella concinna]